MGRNIEGTGGNTGDQAPGSLRLTSRSALVTTTTGVTFSEGALPPLTPSLSRRLFLR